MRECEKSFIWFTCEMEVPLLQCDQIGQFLNDLDYKFPAKNSQNIWQLLRPLLKMILMIWLLFKADLHWHFYLTKTLTFSSGKPRVKWLCPLRFQNQGTYPAFENITQSGTSLSIPPMEKIGPRFIPTSGHTARLLPSVSVARIKIKIQYSDFQIIVFVEIQLKMGAVVAHT